ncbi:MAG: tRNA pseudouridine(55) synthase TruB [Caldisericia bacterium]
MGAIPINKPMGITSFKLSDAVKKLFGEKKGGYVGTLDENATGVLLVMVGVSTKLIPYLKISDKTYVATFELGSTSTTYDKWGEVTEHGYDGSVSKEHIESIMSKFSGVIDQIPPMYSAKKIDGKRLYKYALEGKELPRKPSKIEIKSLVLDEYDQEKGFGKFTLRCSKGTYVRSLISDIGSEAGCGAIMTSLERVEDNGFDISECHSISDIEKCETLEKRQELLVKGLDLIKHIPEVEIVEKQTKKLLNGNPVQIHGKPARTGIVRMVYNESLFGLGKLVVSTGLLYPERLI